MKDVSKPLERVHMALCDPSLTTSLRGSKYLQLRINLQNSCGQSFIVLKHFWSNVLEDGALR